MGDEGYHPGGSLKDEEQIVKIVASIALFGCFNRCNDTLATDLETSPHKVAEGTLSGVGWAPGEHACNAQFMTQAIVSSDKLAECQLSTLLSMTAGDSLRALASSVQ